MSQTGRADPGRLHQRGQGGGSQHDHHRSVQPGLLLPTDEHAGRLLQLPRRDHLQPAAEVAQLRRVGSGHQGDDEPR